MSDARHLHPPSTDPSSEPSTERSAPDWQRILERGQARCGRRATSSQREELRTILEEAYEEALAGGASRQEAERRALRTLGSWEELAVAMAPSQRPRARTRNRPRPLSVLGGFLYDLRLALRGLRHRPGLSLVSVLVLALGIGVITAVYSVLHAIVLAPLPYDQPERLGTVRIDTLGQEGLPWISRSNILDFGEAESLAGLELFNPGKDTLELAGRTTIENAIWVSPGLLRLLGTEPMLGRDLGPISDDAREVLISHQLFERRFDAKPEVVGSTVSVGARPAQIVGVLRPDFRFHYDRGRNARRDLWIGVPKPTERGTILRQRSIVRLASDISYDEASLELDAIASRSLALDGGRPDEGGRYEVVPFADHLSEPYRGSLVALLVAGACVLLLVCANVAGLLVVRSVARRDEWALRSALGAQPMRIAWAGLAEGLILSTVGGTIATLIALLVVRVLRADIVALPRVDSIAIDPPVLLFALTVSVLAGLLAGVVPALLSARSSLNRSRAGLGIGRGATRPLAVVQVAIALTLLVGAGVLLRTVVNLHRVDLGFDAEGLVAFDFSTPRELFGDDADRLRLTRELISGLEAIPGVEAASVTNQLPLDGGLNLASWTWDRANAGDFGELSGSFHRVLPGYFGTLGIPFLSGRDFTHADTEERAHVVIVSDSLARRAWGVGEALGKSIQIEFATAEGGTELRSAEVIGVVPEVREVDLHSDQVPQAYLPYWPESRAFDYVVRPSSPGVDLREPIGELLSSLGPGMVLDDYTRYEQRLVELTAERRLALVLVSLFAAIAMLVAALGLYGVLAHRVRQQRGEIGVRIALGASRTHVALGVVRQALTILAAGLLVGSVAAIALVRVYRSQLYGVEAGDPLTLGLGIGLLLVVGLGAAALPAGRATRTEPIETLRSE